MVNRNKDHYVRDVTFEEDRCKARTTSAPSILAVMRSYAIGALRLLNFTNIANGLALISLILLRGHSCSAVH
jgi:hypothetical protein